MNFWTFVDRNGEGLFILAALTVIMVCVAVPATVHEMRKPRPCVCAEVDR